MDEQFDEVSLLDGAEQYPEAAFLDVDDDGESYGAMVEASDGALLFDDVDDALDDELPEELVEASAAKALRSGSGITGRAGRRRIRLNVPGGYAKWASVRRAFAISDAERLRNQRSIAGLKKGLRANNLRDAKTRKTLRALDLRERRVTASMRRSAALAAKRERNRFYISTGFAVAGTLIAIYAASKE